MRTMFRDAGNQSIFWSGFSGVLAWLGEQQNLMLLSLALGILTALVNLYAKCSEGQARRRHEEREEELFELKKANLKRGLRE